MLSNGELRRRAIAIIEGGRASNAEKLDLLLGITLDVQANVTAHDGRLADLERWPEWIKLSGKVVAAVAGLLGFYALLANVL